MDYLKTKLIPLAAFCVYFVKVCSTTVSYSEASILLILASIACFYEFKSNDSKLKELEEKYNKQQKELEDKSKDIDAIKSSIASMKLSSGIRPMGQSR